MPSTGALERLIVSNRRMEPTSPPAGRALRDIAIDLIELTGLSQRDVATRAGVHRPNLTTWLSGKAQQLSEGNQLAVLNVLGWHYGRLATEYVHRWWVGEGCEAAARLLLEEANAGAKIGVVCAEGCSAAQGASAVLIADANQVQRFVMIRRPLAAHPPIPAAIDAQILGVGTTLKATWLVDAWQWGEAERDPFPDVLDTLPDAAFLELLGAPTYSQSDSDEEAPPIDWDFELKMIVANWTDSERDDWVALLSALRQSGLSVASIARRLGLAMSSRRIPASRYGRYGQIVEKD